MKTKPDWYCILEGICPFCREVPMENRDGQFICSNHKVPIKIPEVRYRKIERDLIAKSENENLFFSL